MTLVGGIAEFTVDEKKISFGKLEPSIPPLEIKAIKETVQIVAKDSKSKIDINEAEVGPEKELLPVIQAPSPLETATKASLDPVKIKKPEDTSDTSQCQSKNETMKPSKPSAREIPLKREEIIKSTKIFSNAIANIKSQDLKSDTATAPSQSPENCPWKKGDSVVVRAVTGVWQNASVLDVKPDRVNSVLVHSPGSPPMWKKTKDIRSSCVPLDALNLIEKDLNSNNVRAQGDGEVADKQKSDIPLPNVVGKVRDWMDRNINIERKSTAEADVSPRRFDSKNGLPQGPKLVSYIQNSSGSNHVQSVLSTSNLSLARYVCKY